MALTTTRKQLREAAADDLGIFISVTADAVDTVNKTVTISKLADATPNREWMADSFLTKDGVIYRRIVSYDGTKVTLTDNLPTLQAGDSVGVYFMLSLDDWGNLIDRMLTTEVWTNKRQTIPLVDNTNEYAVASDVQNMADITGVFFRDTNGTVKWEGEVGGIRWIESDNALTAHLPHLPTIMSGISLIIMYRARYTALASDTATTTCPYELAFPQLCVDAINKMDNKFGAGFSQKLSKAWARANAKLIAAKAKHMPPIQSRDFTWDTDWNIDMPIEILEGSW